MSFAGFVFDMIRRDKENRDMRNLRRERHNQRLDKLYEGSNGMPRNTTAEDMDEIIQLTKKKEQSEQNYIVKMMFIFLGICILAASILVLIFII
ncbi:MAG: hypothetical protein LUE99_08050 [Bacteroides sp.]|nr:hypothetical protein [Bacteroides sp.]